MIFFIAILQIIKNKYDSQIQHVILSFLCESIKAPKTPMQIFNTKHLMIIKFADGFFKYIIIS